MARLDIDRRCCGRKPLEYRRPPHLFCTRCAREYDVESGDQQPNWAWKLSADGDWMRVLPVGRTTEKGTP